MGEEVYKIYAFKSLMAQGRDEVPDVYADALVETIGEDQFEEDWDCVFRDWVYVRQEFGLVYEVWYSDSELPEVIVDTREWR